MADYSERNHLQDTPQEANLPTGRAHPEHVKWSVRFLELADKAFHGGGADGSEEHER